jgi:hypothetical protein
LIGSNADISIENFFSFKDKKVWNSVCQIWINYFRKKIFANIVNKLLEKLFKKEIMENKQVRITYGNAEFFINGIEA